MPTVEETYISTPTVSLLPWLCFADAPMLLSALLDDLYGEHPPLSAGGTIVIKPNLTANAPANSGGTTHVELVEAVISAVRAWEPARIVVAEGTGAFGATHDSAFPTGGWREMARRQGVELYNLDAGEHVVVSLPRPRYPHLLPISRLILEADLFISVPLLKTHISADYTLALKNSFALTPQVKRSEIHRQYLLEEALVDINRVRPADLVIVDGWDGAEGIAGGTDFERPAAARVILAGNDPVAVDVIGRRVMGLKLRTRYLEWAVAEGVGCGDPAAIRLCGPEPEGLCHPFATPADELREQLPELTLWDGDACSGCRVAALGALRRARPPRLLRPLTLVYGQHEELPATTGDVLVIGDCAAPWCDRGTCITGCPPNPEAVHGAMRQLGSLCHLCQEQALEVLGTMPPEALADLRATAAGETIFTGLAADPSGRHRALIVGDCSASYAQTVRERAPQFGMDADRGVLFVPGCPVSPEAIRRALSKSKPNR